MIPFGSSSNTTANAAVPDAPTMGYTIVSTGPNLCDLYSVDLVTGVLTDLPATTSEAACAADLAVAPNGTVYGIAGTQYLGPVAVTPAYDSFGGAELITPSRELCEERVRMFGHLGQYDATSRDWVAGLALVEQKYPDYKL